MRYTICILLLFTTISCSRYEELNKKIFEEQKNHIKKSAFNDARGTFDHIKAQKKFRGDKLPELLKFKLSEMNTGDTIYLMESFAENCIKCASDVMHLLLRDELIVIESYGNYKVDSVRFNKDSIDSNYQRKYGKLIEIRRKELNNIDWTSNALELGSNNCFGGNYTYITAIYPNGRIKTLYVRCWQPEIQRN